MEGDTKKGKNLSRGIPNGKIEFLEAGEMGSSKEKKARERKKRKKRHKEI